jgi:hypothetical protein
MVYLAIKGNYVVNHTSMEAMKQLDGIDTPDMEISDEEFSANDNLARIINGSIFLGKTNAEKQSEINQQRIIELKKLLLDSDYIGARIAEESASKIYYEATIQARAEWRAELEALIEATA